jgi:hypothetical protein
MPAHDLWSSTHDDDWVAALHRYDQVIGEQGVASLAAHDVWYHTELPSRIAERSPAFVSHDELVRITEWKMARGVWRARNLVLVRGNSPELVESTTREALTLVPHPSAPIARVAELAGVGPATASAVLAAFAPDTYPFFDELVAAQVPELGVVAFTPAYYKRYASALRERAAGLGGVWTPARVERALWSNVGGKTGVRA